jgi:hypothetical protein
MRSVWGPTYSWQDLSHLPIGRGYAVTVTTVGAALLLVTPRRWWFLVATLAVIGSWIVLGLPHSACSLPIVSGVRFGRHLLPHFQMLFIFTVAMAIHGLSGRMDRKWPWVAFAAACAVSVWLGVGTHPVFMRGRVLACSGVGAALGLIAASLRNPSRTQVAARRGAVGLGLMLFAFPPYFFGSPMAVLLCQGKAGARQIAPLPTELDASRPLGAVQRLSRGEDRRHYSPSAFLYPNWSAAIGVLDLLSLNALYPIGYHELNGSLFSGWERDPGHALVPDRFVAAPPQLAMSTEFQRVMVLNRVSLLTFATGQASFAEPGSPYQANRCQLVARDAIAESYECPAVGGVGFFPDVVRIVQSRREAIEILRRAAPAELVKMVLLGPELDLTIGGSGPADAWAGAGRVVSVDRRGDDLTYILDVERGGMFVIADTYFRGWAAKVNGQPAGISRANVAFKAVRVPQGRVELRLHFSLAL